MGFCVTVLFCKANHMRAPIEYLICTCLKKSSQTSAQTILLSNLYRFGNRAAFLRKSDKKVGCSLYKISHDASQEKQKGNKHV